MSSLKAAINFLSNLGFSRSDSSSLMHQFNNEMSQLMTTTQEELCSFGLLFDQRLRLLIAIRCFHMEKWSKHLMRHFNDDTLRLDPFENFVFHLLKYQIWIHYASWSIKFVDQHLIEIDENDEKKRTTSFYVQLIHLHKSIDRLHRVLIDIRKILLTN